MWCLSAPGRLTLMSVGCAAAPGTEARAGARSRPKVGTRPASSAKSQAMHIEA